MVVVEVVDVVCVGVDAVSAVIVDVAQLLWLRCC